MGSLRSLSAKMRQASRAVTQNADKLVQDCALGVLANVVNDTPVDKGVAISNWQVRLQSSAQDTIPAFAPGKKGSTRSQNVQGAIQLGKTTIAQYAHGQVVHITNNLPYIVPLNDGWSNQAPPGYVQDAVLEAIRKIQIAGFTITSNIPESDGAS